MHGDLFVENRVDRMLKGYDAHKEILTTAPCCRTSSLPL